MVVGSFQPLTITIDKREDVTIVHCAGEVDIATAGQLRTEVTDALVDGPGDLVVVLDDVTFLDSLGLGALISAHKRARVLQGTFTIVCTSRPVLRVFSATAMDRVFRIVDTLDAALEPA